MKATVTDDTPAEPAEDTATLREISATVCAVSYLIMAGILGVVLSL